jgi:hypothetical protein
MDSFLLFASHQSSPAQPSSSVYNLVTLILSLCPLQVQISHAIAAGENHYHSTWAPELVCDCDLVSLRRKMKTGRNKNMWYYKCCN